MREIVLRLALKNYERARELSQAVSERVDRTLARAREVSSELRSAEARQQRLGQAEDRAAALSQRAEALRARDVQGLEARQFGGVFGRVNQVRGRVESLGRLILDERDPGQALRGFMAGAAPYLLGVGPLLALLAPLTDQVFSRLEERLESELNKREERLLARLEEERFRADYSRRLKEDPAFARAEARRAFEQTLDEEAALGRRIEPTSADLSLSDFGL